MMVLWHVKHHLAEASLLQGKSKSRHAGHDHTIKSVLLFLYTYKKYEKGLEWL